MRLTHEPTGIVAQCQDQKSQHKNKDKALKVLRSRLYELELSKKLKQMLRREILWFRLETVLPRLEPTTTHREGDRSPHRFDLYDLQNIINGDISKLIDELQLFQNTEKLKEAGRYFKDEVSRIKS